jgi:hypothetical protein
MADLSIVPYHQKPGSAGDRRRRQDRRAARGLMSDSRTGFSSRNRRDFLQRAIYNTPSANPLTVALVRKRYQRRLWQVQAAISTAAPTQ